MTETAYTPVARSKAQQMTTEQWLVALTPEIKQALPEGMDSQRIARLVMTEVRKNPRLGECTRLSFAGALLTASALGLEPGVNGECYLVPYRDTKKRIVECQLIIGYQGIVKLFWQHPTAARLSAEWVGANDEFGYTKGLRQELWHHPATGDRGEPVYYYAIVQTKGAEPIWDVFTPEDIAKLRRGKVGPSGDIPDPQHWMERKTALKQVLKLAPKTTRLDLAVRADESSGTELYKSQAMDVPAIGKEPDFIDGECEEQSPGDGMAADKGGDGPAANGTPPPSPGPGEPNEVMADQNQLTRLAIIRDERYPKTVKGRTDWFKWVHVQIGRTIGTNAHLTRAEATVLLDVLEPAPEPDQG